MKIEIKERKLTEGKRALYLEYYETGFRKRENLHLYLLPDDAVGAAKHNRLTYNKAMEIRAERIPSCIGERECQKRRTRQRLDLATMVR